MEVRCGRDGAYERRDDGTVLVLCACGWHSPARSKRLAKQRWKQHRYYVRAALLREQGLPVPPPHRNVCRRCGAEHPSGTRLCQGCATGTGLPG